MTSAGCLSRLSREEPRLVYVALENQSSERKTVDLKVNADGETRIDTSITLSSIDKSTDQPDPSDAPYQCYLTGDWPERGTYEVVARLTDIDRTFRSTSRGIEPGSDFGLMGMVHPGRDAIGWFSETVGPDEITEYENWLERYGETR
ncbi:hypothetical protein Halru_0020 [Halovivax ruber XH-70]|uniref:Uncharacterized protein n=1 Tax=Halovivax ruber (strain DSM 18193 / JCM 13892 / XH-70) TaxID=797302 RepID=L0I571_HALRX|nr:hypothetical protein Halru_0020 [Halovivax ruber XH-70]